MGLAHGARLTAAAASLPLTSLTAWEMLFDRLAIRRDASAGRTLLIIGAAGGVGSMAVQLARRLTDLTVIGTASRPETAAWVRELGAHHTLDHGRPMPPQLQMMGPMGGDEVNITRAGMNYGWPLISYGCDYGLPVGNCPTAKWTSRIAGGAPSVMPVRPSSRSRGTSAWP